MHPLIRVTAEFAMDRARTPRENKDGAKKSCEAKRISDNAGMGCASYAADTWNNAGNCGPHVITEIVSLSRMPIVFVNLIAAPSASPAIP